NSPTCSYSIFSFSSCIRGETLVEDFEEECVAPQPEMFSETAAAAGEQATAAPVVDGGFRDLQQGGGLVDRQHGGKTRGAIGGAEGFANFVRSERLLRRVAGHGVFLHPCG